MKFKKMFLVVILILIVFISGCGTVKNSKLDVEERELHNGDSTNLTLNINYEGLFGTIPEPQSFSVQFITGKHLEVRSDVSGPNIEKDIIFNVTEGKNPKSYYLVAKNLYSGQEVETVEVVLTSNDGEITYKTRSDFILIKSR